MSHSFRFVTVTVLISKELVGSDGRLESADKSCVIVEPKLAFTPHKVALYIATRLKKVACLDLRGKGTQLLVLSSGGASYIFVCYSFKSMIG